MMITDPDPFGGCASLDEFFFLIFDLAGAGGLRALLAQVDLDRETLNVAANKLEQASLIDGASLVRQAALKAETRAAREIAATKGDEVNQPGCLPYLYRIGRMDMVDMMAAGVAPDVMAYVEKARRGGRAVPLPIPINARGTFW